MRVVADPLRRRVLLHLSQPHSIREIAALLGESQQKLNYHFHLLERHGFIVEVGSRLVGRNHERIFKTSGPFRIAPSLAADAGYSVNLGVQTVLEESARRFAGGYQHANDGPYDPVFHLVAARLDSDAVARLKSFVEGLVSECQALDAPQGGWHGLTVVLHPIEAPQLLGTDRQDDAP